MIDLSKVLSASGKSISDLSEDKNVMLVFLRHFGCIFCKGALTELSNLKSKWDSDKTNLVFVHMADENVAEQHFQEFDLKGIDHISDPECELYQQFGLMKGSLGQLFGLNSLIRGFKVSKEINQPLTFKQIGDSFQMPGIFMIQKGQIKMSYIHKTVSDKPDYEKLLNCCSG